MGWEGGRSLLAALPPSLVSCNGVAGAGYAGVQYRRGGEGGGGSLQHTTREVGLWSVTTQRPHSRQITQRLILRIAGWSWADLESAPTRLAMGHHGHDHQSPRSAFEKPKGKILK